ncbi:nose resistant to fluoxetine protein 6-like [Anthonomus grandis grandis]|uniref:nose resistant to fluoxetine protein 6-like n=1 Tax=Anthonomus grandis grandis TaxID=2921223 RepID=UPI0021661497|nr:nose resistant to fluoxetine protein 6-like [Anthonomus grandis grandis]
MKQGLILNQILNTYGLSDVSSNMCRNHIDEFKLALRALEPWALKMFDASSKLMPGILAGNLAELGSYKECLSISEDTIYGPIKGRHCTLHIHPADKLIKIVVGFKKPISDMHFRNLKNNILDEVKIIWSVCVPDSCSYKDVLHHFNKSILDVTEGLNLTLSLKETQCSTAEDTPEFSGADLAYFVCIGSIIIIVCISTILDLFLAKDSIPETASLFSLKRNSKILFCTKAKKDDISCLHGLRFLSMCLIVYGHRYIHNMATPIVNYMDLLEWLESYYSTTVHGGTTTVDTFLLISATLLSYGYFNITSKGVKINLFFFYLSRHLRLLVPLLLAVSTVTLMTKHFGGGPFYQNLNSYNEITCGYFWWSALLYLQPFVNPKSVCIVQTWYLSVDMFWYYCSPILLMTIGRSHKMGYIVLSIIYIICTIINFSIAWENQFNGQMPVTPNLLSTDYFSRHYIQPIIRGGPYILGLVFGHILFKTKGRTIKISLCMKMVGWIMVSVCMPSIVIITRLFRLDGFTYNRTFASLFLAFHRSAWTVCIMWIIWSCQHTKDGKIIKLLCLSI